jgi:tRNA (cmo5U34)-methyltransferase
MSSSTAGSGWESSDTELFTRYGDAFVPRRREQIDTACQLLEELPGAELLDLCCGEGLLATEYLRRIPHGRVTLLDGSAEMLAAAAAGVSKVSDRYETVQANLEDRAWREGRTYGGVVSSLAIHHLDGEGKKLLYRDLHSMLSPGGVFVMLDLVEPAGAAARELAADQWDKAVLDASQEEFGTDEALGAFERSGWNYFRLPGPDDVDKPSSAIEHVDWLQEAGFDEIDIPWAFAGHVVIVARREPSL